MINKNYKTFNKSLLAKTISVMLGTSVMVPVLAEENKKEEEKVEVIQVTADALQHIGLNQ